MADRKIQPHSANARFSNTQGQIIPLHHAFLTLQMNSFSRVSAIVMPLIFLALIWLFMPMILTLWSVIFEFWMSHIYQGNVDYKTVRILGQNLYMPYPFLGAQMPTEEMVYINLIVCVIAFLVSFLVPARAAPVNYLMRAILLIQASASLDRIISPENFSYTLPIYLVDALSLSIYMIFLLPVVLGFVYYIFDFHLWKKILLTIGMLAYFLLTIPCQYMLHAFIVHEWTLLFLPLMYLMFGTLLNVLMFVSIYGLGMSWKSSKQVRQGGR